MTSGRRCGCPRRPDWHNRNHVIDSLPIDPGVAGHQGFERHGSQVIRPDRRQRAAKAADGSSDVIANKSVCHGDAFLKSLKQSNRQRQHSSQARRPLSLQASCRRILSHGSPSIDNVDYALLRQIRVKQVSPWFGKACSRGIRSPFACTPTSGCVLSRWHAWTWGRQAESFPACRRRIAFREAMAHKIKIAIWPRTKFKFMRN